jgi:hypothetical protein
VLVLLAAVVAVAVVSSTTTSAVWASHQFTDVPATNPFHADIAWAANNDIAEGFPNGAYQPSAPVSRQAFAAFLHRYNNELEIVRHDANFTSVTSHTNPVVCPGGKRPVAAGGTTSAVGFAMTDISVSASTASVRWESKNDLTRSGTSNVWALCVPG